MKATTFKLFATILTLAAITIITTVPAQAQRRGGERGTEKREAPKRSSKSEVKTKSASKTYRQSTPATSDRGVRSSSRTTSSRNSANVRSSNNKYNDSRSVNRDVQQKSSSNNSYKTQKSTTRASDNVYRKSEPQRTNESRGREATRQPSRVYTDSKKSNPSVTNGRGSSRSSVTDTRRYYNVDRNDKRFTPTKSYRGSSTQWSSRNRPKAMNYNYSDRKYYSNYNYHKNRHWDNRWEHYHWNHHSWRDYYGGYNPYSYRYHKYYYYNSHYGHVIRKFVYRPTVFVHNHNRYYCYDGHFFRYHRGIGYVLVNLPFGFSFERLPYGYEQVHINGYLYFRIGNLFFESTALGFSLVHYPDRYYAYNDDYYSPGYVDEYYYEPY
ncbi:hypothetical protein [Draconibacterium sediminis]|uniref:Uncharacterized protein n=1 Tax=Draconibacterium sediminis TaxID=1544798 RepID=A0A0D8J6I3_9BACT|nr:hypothetical protein [Draconibacterium sediminis]KJF42507.1 hypothetical protein LH29_18325 [Draconibacterium sediminis]